MARPTKLTKKLGEDICNLICERYSLKQIEEKGDKYPNKSTILRWNTQDGEIYKWFQDLYARALIIRAHAWAEEILDISDDGTNDWIERQAKNGKTYKAIDNEAVQRSRLRVDSRKFLLAKMLPKLYGDKAVNTPKEDSKQRRPIIFNRGDTRPSQITNQDEEKKNGTE